MATSASFKQICPSCEHPVPIRDPKLIGRKIDCPKCKYRFVVEEPVADVAEEEEPVAKSSKKGSSQTVKAKSAASAKSTAKGKAARGHADEEGANGEKKAGKKKVASSTTLILGIGLGTVALALLGIGAYFLFARGDETKPTRSPSMGKANTPPPPPPSSDGNKPVGLTKSTKSSNVDPTNLLPNDSEAVLEMNMDLLSSGLLGSTAFDDQLGVFSTKEFERKWSIPFHKVERIISAYAYSESKKWQFHVLRTSERVDWDKVKSNLALEKGDQSPIQGQDYYMVKTSLDSFSLLFLKGLPINGPMALHKLDDQTLVMGNEETVRKFLEDKGKPKQLSQSSAPAPASQPADNPPGRPASPPPGSPLPPGGPGNRGNRPPRPPGNLPPGRPGPGGPAGTNLPPANGPTPPSTPSTSSAKTTGSSSYLTINPALKTIMDRLGSDKQKPLFRLAIESKLLLQTLAPSSKQLPFGGYVETGRDFVLRQFKNTTAGGLALQAMRSDRGTLLAAIQANSEGAASNVHGILRPLVPALAVVLTNGLRIQFSPQTLGQPNLPGNFPGLPNPGGPPGRRPRPNQPGGGRMPPVPPGQGGTSQQSMSKLSLDMEANNMVTFTADLILNSYAETAISQITRQMLVVLKGVADMHGSQSRVHELALALKSYTTAAGHFPRGAVDRHSIPERAGRPWPPPQRVSWVAEVIRYLPQYREANLGESNLPLGIDVQKSWRDLDNLPAAQTLIPQLMSTESTFRQWWIMYPGVPTPVATTHFVGVAGIGLDAASFSGQEPKVASRLGVFGYDRQTKLTDIKDGPEQTIAVIEVPPIFNSAWLAGGGSTIRGVPETDSVRPFVCTEFKGKRGTMAIMANGDVRFIPETISDDDFKKLCTIAGGDKLNSDVLDRITTLVPASSQQVELKRGQLAAPPASKIAPPATVAPPETSQPATPKVPASPKSSDKAKPKAGDKTSKTTKPR